MAAVAQTIPSYAGGISEQPDQLKFPGQVRDVQNAIPDVTWGLYKRPGSKRVSSTHSTGTLQNVQSTGSFFHYYRDESEGSYIGQVDEDGFVRMWKASGTNAGQEVTVEYDTAGQTYSSGDADHTAIASATDLSPITKYQDPAETHYAYLKHKGVGTTESIQALTINDTTYLVNRDREVKTTGTVSNPADTHRAFIELQRTENGRQYGFNISDSSGTTHTVKTATRLTIVSDNLAEGYGTGHCPAIGTQVFSVTAGSQAYYAEKGTQHTIATGSVDTTDNEIDISSHTFRSGDHVYYEANGGTVLGGLSDNTVYYAFCGDDRSMTDSIQLGTSYDNVVQRGIAKESESVINLTGTGNSSQTVSILQTLDVKNAAGSTITTGRDNLIFRITLLGQQGGTPNRGYSDNDQRYCCSYKRQIELLHGGEGWEDGDIVTVIFNNCQGPVWIKVKVVKTEELPVRVGGYGADGAVRPEPTPFDADTAVTADSILGGIKTNLPSGITATIVGPGLYLTASSAFQVQAVDNDLVRVIGSDTNNVQNLPNQCKHGYVVKIANTRMSDEDDYWMKFEGENGQDGPGSWIECAEPGITLGFNSKTMPHVLIRQANGNFLVKKGTYQDRLVGDDNTNPLPSFADGTSKINKVLFFRNRLAFLSSSNCILSKAGQLATPDFFAETAISVSAIDPIDITSSSNFPSDLFDGIEIPAGLVLFSANQQFLLSSDDTVLDNETAKLRAISTYNYNTTIPPISLGTTLAYIDNSGKYSRLNQMSLVRREAEPTIEDITKLVPSLLPKDIDLITNSRENQLILLGKTDSDLIYGLKYFRTERGANIAWFKWKLNNPIKYHFVIDDNYFFLDTDNFLQTLQLVQESEDASLTQDGENYLIHLDNWTTIYGGVYNSTTKVTTFTDGSNSCEFTWQASVTSPNGNLVLIDTNDTSTRVGRYAELTVTSAGATFTVPGDWSQGTDSAPFHIGYLYDYQVDIPRIYVTEPTAQGTRTDVNASLIVHRLKLNFGKIGLYETTLTREGKADYTEVYESSTLNEYNVSDAPYLEEKIKTIPVYEKNENVDIRLKSAHPAPATLHSITWEGDYTPKYYQRR